MKRKRKGRVPPHLKKYLFKKGRRKVRAKKRKVSVTRKKLLRTRAKQWRAYAKKQPDAVVPERYRKRPRRYNPSGRMQAGGMRERYIIVAKRGPKTLRFTGTKFSDSGKATQFALKAQAMHTAKSLLSQYRILIKWDIYVKPHTGK